jgi:1-acyl-sn-glycerol-3-phosphate acyltransferase
MRSQDSPELRDPPLWAGVVGAAAALANAARLYAGLLTLAALCFIASAAIFGASVLLPRRRRLGFARSAITTVFRTQFQAMALIGVMRLDLSAVDALRDGPALIVAPNHPSMIDAALLLSRMSDLSCIMKAEVLGNVLFGFGARMAGYITNDPLRTMLRSAVDHLHDGHHLLLFPEGTRTQRLPVNKLQRTTGLVAKRAGVPVQAVIIETNTAFLGKGWPLLRVPALPMEYRLRLGRRFDPPENVDAFADQLEEYFRDELARSRLPVLPAERRSAPRP